VKIVSYVLKSKILNKELIICSEWSSNFEKGQDVLENAFVKIFGKIGNHVMNVK
jgi:hypothetical protein